MDIQGALRDYGFLGTMARVPRKIARVARTYLARMSGADVTRTAYGVLMRSNWGDFTFELCYHGSYGRTLSDLLTAQRTPFIFLDIGANQGLYSLIAAANPQCAQVYSFEPVAATLTILRDNIQLNHHAGRVTVFPFGISDRDEELLISIKPGHSGVASLHHAVGADSERIRVRTMANVASEIVPRELPLIVKIDVEGHERTVLRELANSVLLERVSAVYYEVDEEWCAPGELSCLLPGFAFLKVGNGRHYDVLATPT